MVMLGSLKIKLTILPNATKNMYPGGWGWCSRILNFSNESAKLTESKLKRDLAINGIRLKIMVIDKQDKVIKSVFLSSKSLYLSKIFNTLL